MNFLTAVAACFNQYVTFSGRASRSEYWYFVLFILLGSIVLVIVDSALFPAPSFQPLSSIFSLITIPPSIAVAARRLHDIDKSGWWQLIWGIPLIGWVVMIVWLVKPGTAGSNRYGSDPLGAMVAATA